MRLLMILSLYFKCIASADVIQSGTPKFVLNIGGEVVVVSENSCPNNATVKGVFVNIYSAFSALDYASPSKSIPLCSDNTSLTLVDVIHEPGSKVMYLSTRDVKNYYLQTFDIEVGSSNRVVTHAVSNVRIPKVGMLNHSPIIPLNSGLVDALALWRSTLPPALNSTRGESVSDIASNEFGLFSISASKGTFSLKKFTDSNSFKLLQWKTSYPMYKSRSLMLCESILYVVYKSSKGLGIVSVDADKFTIIATNYSSIPIKSNDIFFTCGLNRELIITTNESNFKALALGFDTRLEGPLNYTSHATMAISEDSYWTKFLIPLDDSTYFLVKVSKNNNQWSAQTASKDIQNDTGHVQSTDNSPLSTSTIALISGFAAILVIGIGAAVFFFKRRQIGNFALIFEHSKAFKPLKPTDADTRYSLTQPAQTIEPGNYWFNNLDNMTVFDGAAFNSPDCPEYSPLEHALLKDKNLMAITPSSSNVSSLYVESQRPVTRSQSLSFRKKSQIELFRPLSMINFMNIYQENWENQMMRETNEQKEANLNQKQQELTVDASLLQDIESIGLNQCENLPDNSSNSISGVKVSASKPAKNPNRKN